MKPVNVVAQLGQIQYRQRGHHGFQMRLIRRRQADHVHHQGRDVVLTAGVQGRGHQALRRLLGRCAFVQYRLYARVHQYAVQSITAQEKPVVGFEPVGGVVGAHVRLQAHGTQQHVLQVRMMVGVIFGQPLQAMLAQAVHARIAHMHDVRLASAQHQRREGGGHIMQTRVLAALGMHPTIHGRQCTRGGAIYS